MNFENFKKRLRSCRYCADLDFEPKPFVGKEKSDKSAKIVQISQQPSKNASESNIPFSDASGKKLVDEWYKIPRKLFDNPKLFYITGVAHCFSPDRKVAARLRRECSKKWLEQELSFLEPMLYIIIGRHSANFFFPRRNFTRLVFENLVLNNKQAFVLPHPSPANKKWFKDNPTFESTRLLSIRNAIHNAINS